MKKVIVLLAIAILVSLQAQAVEDKPQMGVSLNVSRGLENNFSLLGNMCFINLMKSYAPYTSLGLGYKFSDKFSVDGFVGYGFEAEEQDRGWFAGVDSVSKSGKWMLVDSFYYYAGLDVLFIYGSLSYPIEFMRVGLDSRNYHYLSKEDEGSRSYQIGPSLTIPFNDKLSLKLNYYYAFEPYGKLPEDSNVYKATLNLNF